MEFKATADIDTKIWECPVCLTDNKFKVITLNPEMQTCDNCKRDIVVAIPKLSKSLNLEWGIK